jgi:Ni,Fe-hydrogenase III small subunit
MFAPAARHRSLFVYALHMGGPDADALEVEDLLSSRYANRLEQLGVTFVPGPERADIVVATGLLTEGNMSAVFEALGRVPSPSVLVAAGDAAVSGSLWSRADLPAVSAHPLSHFAEVTLTVPGDPPTPQALVAAISAAAQSLARPPQPAPTWEED